MAHLLAAFAALSTGLLAMATSAFAQPVPVRPTYAILQASTATHTFERRQVRTRDGSDYELFRALPKASPPASGFPILTLLDGNAAFDQLTPQMLAAVPDLVVIGIGYDTEQRFDSRRRSLDYTPPLSTEGPVPDPERPGGLVGGADRFLHRLVGEFREASEAGLPIDPERRTLWGHSYGGLFALYTLLVEPDAFTRYAAVSPSVDWGKGVLRRLEETADRPPHSIRTVVLAFGDSERRGSVGPDGKRAATPKAPHPEGMRSKIVFGETIAKRPNITFQQTVFEGFSHGETFLASLPLTLELADR